MLSCKGLPDAVGRHFWFKIILLWLPPPPFFCLFGGAHKLKKKRRRDHEVRDAYATSQAARAQQADNRSLSIVSTLDRSTRVKCKACLVHPFPSPNQKSPTARQPFFFSSYHIIDVLTTTTTTPHEMTRGAGRPSNIERNASRRLGASPMHLSFHPNSGRPHWLGVIHVVLGGLSAAPADARGSSMGRRLID